LPPNDVRNKHPLSLTHPLPHPETHVANDAPRRTPPRIDADFYGWFGTLTEEESVTRLAVRRVMEEVVAPVVNQCWQAEEFPYALRDAFREMDLLDR
jgi:hypothetical protein